MSSPPITFRWDGEVMVPLQRFAKTVDREFVIGEIYTLAEVRERSAASHRQYFALVREAWLNLPEDQAERFINDNQLRKHALIKAGFRTERSFPCSSKAEAIRLAAFLRPPGEDYALIIVRDNVVTEYRAKSQDLTSMDRAEFQASKDAVLGFLADTLGVSPATLQRHQEPA